MGIGFRIVCAACIWGLLLNISAKSVYAAAAAIEPAELRCEYLVNPLGLHEAAPRLSWIVTSPQRGQSQNAYQILVATSAQTLAQDKGDLWDTGKVPSDQTSQIPYAGAPLASRAAAYWKVRAWDRDGNPSPWSKPALWTMGLLHPDDWHAKWIDARTTATPAGELLIQKAAYAATDGTASADVTATLAKLVKDGTLTFTANNATLGGDPALNHVKELRIDYQSGGKTLHQTFPEGDAVVLPAPSQALQYMRKSFALTKPIRQATVYVTALGLYELHLNGQRVGDHILAPEWTDYGKRVNYQTYDVTPLVKTGDNALGAQIAKGWYAGHIGNGNNQRWGKVPALLAQLEVTYADGTVDRIVSDATWKIHESAILSTDFMKGENVDARQELAGWDLPGIDDQTWPPATVRDEAMPPARPLVPQISPPVRELAQVAAKSVAEPKPGRWTFDMGQNMVGVVRLKVTAPAGTVITLHHAEMLNPDGTVYLANLRAATSVDTYICKGGDAEVWQPHFTFHGFRYVELTGLTAKPPLDAVTGIVLGTDLQWTGTFSCSDPRINQLQSNIQWGQRGNYLSVPTDCPQRDERLGWMGDAEVFVRTATGNADVAAFFTKWLVDVDDAQTEDGAFSDVSPKVGANNGTPAWGDAGVICPWTIYQAYGDKRLLQQHLPAMTAWVEWCRTHSTNLIRNKDRGGDYGDWLSIAADTPKELIGTACFAYSTHLVAESYAALGNADQAAKYRQLFDDIKSAFNKKYVAADGRIQGNTQCCYALALKFDLLPDDLRAKAAQYLEDDIKAKGWHLSTGFVGVSHLLPVLTQAGKVDTAYKLLLQDTFPSWLFSVKQGATTIWERWDGWTPDRGFQDAGMNSFNHYSLGSCGQWLYDTAAGIGLDPDQPGYKHLIIRPRPGAGLTWAKATMHSIHGEMASGWTLNNGTLTIDVTIPTNTSATVYVPAANAADVTESGKPAAQTQGIKFLRMEDASAVFEVPSGKYQFAAPQK